MPPATGQPSTRQPAAALSARALLPEPTALRAEPGGPSDDALAELALGARTLGVELGPQALAALVRYLDLLQRWGRVHNLSAIERVDEAVRLHLLDSLSLVPLLDRARPQGGVLLDVGTGAGLPAVVVAIARPGWQVVAVDAVAKKAAFVAQVAIELGLSNLEALHGRAEAIGSPEAPTSLTQRRWQQRAPAGADVVVSRAFASLDDFTRLTWRALAADGVWIAMKGRRPEAEEAMLSVAAPESQDTAGRHVADLATRPRVEVFHVEPLHVPGLAAERCALWMRPRRGGSMARP
jgi:16S rRNA (guanine527-N7)-methyltransferase